MSYEGYVQFLCKNHHQGIADVFDDLENLKCQICDEKIIWYNYVDLTNGSYDDDGKRIDNYIELEKKIDAEFKTCPTCKHREIVKHQTYNIPKKGNKL